MYTRIIKHTLRSLLASPEILILYGPRRVGKTTLLQMLYHERLQASEPTAIYSLDDPTAQAADGRLRALQCEDIPLFGHGRDRMRGR
jgi:predicted AAA+ superfamily ATPase